MLIHPVRVDWSTVMVEIVRLYSVLYLWGFFLLLQQLQCHSPFFICVDSTFAVASDFTPGCGSCLRMLCERRGKAELDSRLRGGKASLGQIGHGLSVRQAKINTH